VTTLRVALLAVAICLYLVVFVDGVVLGRLSAKVHRALAVFASACFAIGVLWGLH
jgi:hypothetical protein